MVEREEGRRYGLLLFKGMDFGKGDIDFLFFFFLFLFIII